MEMLALWNGLATCLHSTLSPLCVVLDIKMAAMRPCCAAVCECVCVSGSCSWSISPVYLLSFVGISVVALVTNCHIAPGECWKRHTDREKHRERGPKKSVKGLSAAAAAQALPPAAALCVYMIQFYFVCALNCCLFVLFSVCLPACLFALSLFGIHFYFFSLLQHTSNNWKRGAMKRPQNLPHIRHPLQ